MPRSSSASRLGRAVASVIERLEGRQMLAGDAALVQSLPFTLEFNAPVSSFVVDKDGEGTGFTWVSVNKTNTEYQPALIDLDTSAGILKLTTTGSSANGGPNEGDNSLVNGVQTEFDATQGAFYITTRLIGPLSYISKPSQQGGIFFSPDQDNYVKVVAVSQPAGNFLQFVDESKSGSTWVHQLGSNSLVSIGSFATINTLDLYLTGDAGTGKLTAYYRINDGTLTKLSQELTLSGAAKSAIFTTTARAGLIAMTRNDLAPIQIPFDRFEIKPGSPLISSPVVMGFSPANASTNIATGALIVATVSQPNGAGVDASTLIGLNVKLYRTSDNAVVAANLTLGANNTIQLSPASALEAGTTYTFAITAGLKDSAGASVQAFSSSFTTAAAAVTAGPMLQVSAATIYFNDVTGGSASPTQKLTITNTGSAPLQLTSDGLQLIGTDASQFTLSGVPTLPATLAVGASLSLALAYNAPTGTAFGIHAASLQLTSNDVAQPIVNVALRGLATAGTGGALEPSLQRIFDLFQIPVNVGTADASSYLFPMPPAAGNDEVVMPKLVKAGAGPVTITPLVSFAVSSTPSVRVGTYSSGTGSSLSELFTTSSTDNQTVNPAAKGATTFDPGSAAFSIYASFPPFSNTDGSIRTVYSEDALNTWEPVAANRRKVRFYPMKNADGSVVPNTYLAAFEEYTSAYDQQDIVLVLRNVAAAPAGPEIGLENRDNGLTFSNRLVFSRIQNPNTTVPNVVHDTATLRVWNTGANALSINSISLSNTSAFSLGTNYSYPLSVAAQSYLDVPVKFVYSSVNSGSSIQNGTMTIGSNDSDEASVQISLSGLWQSHSEATPSGMPTEQSLKNMIAQFGYKTTILGTGQAIEGGGKVTSVGEEILSGYWTRSDISRPVVIKQLAAYHTQGNGAQVRWFSKGSSSTNLLFTNNGTDSQSILPHILNSSTAYAQGSFSTASVFGLKVDSESSDDSLNMQEQVGGGYGHHVRFWPARDQAGNVMSDTWIMAMDYNGINYDYNDNIYLISNMRPANPAAPTGLTAIGTTAGVSLDWADNTDTTLFAYNLYRSATSTGTYTKVSTSPVLSSDFVDSTGTAGVTYYYKVNAIDAWGGESALSASISGKRLTGSDTIAPSKPLGLTIAAQQLPAGLIIHWSSNTEADLAGYNVDRATSPSGTFTRLNLAGLLTTSAFTDTTVVAGVTYTYRVTAIDTSANESTPATISGTYIAPSANDSITLGATADTYVRDGSYAGINYGNDSLLYVKKDGTGSNREGYFKFDLTSLTGTVATAKLRVYGRLSDTDTGGVNVAVYDAAISTWTETGLTFANRPATGASLATGNVPSKTADWIEFDLTNWLIAQKAAGKTEVTLVIKALANNGGSLVSLNSRNASTSQPQLVVGLDTGSYTPPPVDTTAPAQPVGLSATQQAAPAGLIVDWSDNTDTDLAGYNVYRSTAAGGTFTLLNTTGLLSASTFTDTTVNSGQTFFYQVTALDTTGNESIAAAASGQFVATVATSVTLGATADTYVRDGSYAGINYGNDSLLYVKKDGTGSNREGYFKFDLTSLTGTVATAKLRVYGRLSDTVTGGVNVAVYDAANSTWTETGLTFANRPATGASLATGNVPSKTADWIEFDLTNWLIAQKAAGKTEVTLVIKALANNGGSLVSLNSRNASTSQPQLVVDLA